MNLTFRRKSAPRHALPAQAPQTDATAGPGEPFSAAPAAVPVSYSPDYDATGRDGEMPLPAPVADDTILFRLPGTDCGPGFVIPPGAPWQAAPQPDPETGPQPDPLPSRTPGAAIPPALVPALRTEPADPALLSGVRDALKGEDTPPAAYLRAVVPGGDTGVTQIQDALGHSPRFAGSGVLADGRAVAGMTLGTNEEGWFIVDVLSEQWCEDGIAALGLMRDYLRAAREQAEQAEQAEDGEAA